MVYEGNDAFQEQWLILQGRPLLTWEKINVFGEFVIHELAPL